MRNIDDLDIHNVEWLESDMFVYIDTRETFTPEELAGEYGVTEFFLRDYLTPGWLKHPIYLHNKERRKKQALASSTEIEELRQSKIRLKSILKKQAMKRASIYPKLTSTSFVEVQSKQAVRDEINKLEKQLKQLKKIQPLVCLASDGEIKTIDNKVDFYLEYYKSDIIKLRALKVNYKDIAYFYGVDVKRLSAFCKKHGITKKRSF